MHSLVLVSLVAALATRFPQQPPSVTLRGPTCPACKITLTRQAVLYEGGEEYGGVTRGTLLQDSKGRFFLKNMYTRSTLLVFDSAGKFLRTVGKTGKGPGEFASILGATVGGGDILHVFDQTNRSYTAFRPDLTISSTSQVPGRVYRAFELKPGTLVINASIPTKSGFGRPVHLWRNGKFGESIGPDILEGKPQPTATSRAIARASDSTFWIADASRYAIDLMTTSGRVVRRLTRNPDWYRSAPAETAEGILNPHITEMQVDKLGRLWVMVRVRARNWRNLVKEFRAPTGKLLITTSTGNPYEYWDTVIEVIDSKSNHVILSQRFDWTMGDFVTSDKLYTSVYDDLGRQRISIWRVSIPETPTAR